jgi:hypothetical protein
MSLGVLSSAVDTSKRLRDAVIQEDVKILYNAKNFVDYSPFRPEAQISYLNDLESKMRFAREAEIQAKAQLRAASAAAQKLEWEFHNGILSLKQSVLAQYGDDSNEAEDVGFTKKSDRKRPQRNPKPAKEELTWNVRSPLKILKKPTSAIALKILVYFEIYRCSKCRYAILEKPATQFWTRS